MGINLKLKSIIINNLHFELGPKNIQMQQKQTNGKMLE
jgi:hypothetical protein